MRREVSEFQQLLAMIPGVSHSKVNDDGGEMTIVPTSSYFVKKFTPESKDLIHTTDLVDCLGLIITDRSNNCVAVAHFHPINCFSKELTKISLEKIKEEFAEIGGNMAEAKVRIIGGEDPRLRETMKTACQESLQCKQISNDGFLNRAGSWDSTHAIIAGDRSYIARIENYRQQRLQDSSLINADTFRVIDALGPESSEEKAAMFFEKCIGIARSNEQKYFKAKANLILNKIVKDDLELVSADRSLNPYSPNSFSVNPATYRSLIEQEEENPIGFHVAKIYHEKGCGLSSVDEIARYRVEERGR